MGFEFRGPSLIFDRIFQIPLSKIATRQGIQQAAIIGPNFERLLAGPQRLVIVAFGIADQPCELIIGRGQAETIVFARGLRGGLCGQLHQLVDFAAEVVRRGLEYITRVYPPVTGKDAGWSLPAPSDLGECRAPLQQWRLLANDPTAQAE